MKFLLKIFIMLALVAIISAVQVERKHHKKHHARSKAIVTAVLCDAGSSKTECSCWTYNTDNHEIKKKGDEAKMGDTKKPAKKGPPLENIHRLGDVFGADEGDQQAYATEYAKNVKTMVGQLDCDGYSTLYVLSTAGSRQQLSEKGMVDPARSTLEGKILTALNHADNFNGKAKLQVYAGRMEGYFGYAYAYYVEKAWTQDSKFVYYECGGSSCQLVFPAVDDSCDTKYWDKQGHSRFRSHKKMTAKRANALKMLARSQGIMLMKPICGLESNKAANSKNYFKVFSNSWLGTGANPDALQSFNDCGAAECETKILNVCEMKEAANPDLFDNCHTALTNLFKSAEVKDKTGEQALGPQMEGAKEQLKCNAGKGDVDPKKILVQSGALSFTVKQPTDLAALKALAQTECAKVKGPGPFDNVKCLTITSYVAYFEALGIVPEAKIKVIKSSNPAAGFFAWLNNGGAVDDKTRWPNPNTNKKEDTLFTQDIRL